MGLQVIQKPRSEDLISLALVQERLGDTTSEEDELLSRLISIASDYAVQEVGRGIVLQTYREASPGYGRHLLWLSRRPVEPESVVVRICGDVETDFVVADARVSKLFRRICWPASRVVDYDSDGVPDLEIDYVAGYVPLYLLAEWSATADHQLGDWIYPQDQTTSTLLFEVTTAGDGGATEPDWSSLAAGDTVSDGSAVLTARNVQPLPGPIEDAVYLIVAKLFEDRPDGLQSDQMDGFRETYTRESVSARVPVQARMALEGFR